jgi:hypothetical protein
VSVFLFAAWPRPWRRWKPLKGHWELLKTPWLGDFILDGPDFNLNFGEKK